MARLLNTQALVIDSRDHAEADLIITFLTPDQGRLSAIAKSAKKSKKRFVNKLELFSFLHIQYRASQHRSLTFLSEAHLHTPFLTLRQEPRFYAAGSVIREFLLAGVREGTPDELLFRLTLWALHRLNCKEDPATTIILFLIRYYDSMGYRPDLQQCGNCDASSALGGSVSFDLQRGSILCGNCGSTHQRGPRISIATLRLLQQSQTLPLGRINRLKFSPRAVQESLFLLHRYGAELLQRDLHSWRGLSHYDILPGDY